MTELAHRMKLQIDERADGQRLSFGEFDEVFPASLPLAAVLDFLVEAVGGWAPRRCVLVGHWTEEIDAVGWRPVTSFPYRQSLLRSSTIQLSEVPTRAALASAIERGWQVPRLLLCVIERSTEDALQRLHASEWKRALEDEVPSALLSLQVPMIALGFYHQRWVSAYLPAARAKGLARELLARFHDELVTVSDEL
ncbi:MAG: hypothetical protein KF819_09250 [Labilithrix sp.]|nr:hypothetical protein [Labilithrix sp.]